MTKTIWGGAFDFLEKARYRGKGIGKRGGRDKGEGAKNGIKIEIVRYTPQLKITNTEQLPRGTGSKYLLVLKDGDKYIAHSWKDVVPKNIPAGYALIKFGK